jgi:hypothetical protein
MPYELLEQVPSCVANGADLVNWILTSLTLACSDFKAKITLGELHA